MFLFASPTTTLMVPHLGANLRRHAKAIKTIPDVEVSADIETALQRVKILKAGREAFLPVLEAVDRDRLPAAIGGERLLRICCNAPAGQPATVPREVSVIVIYAEKIDKRLKSGIKRLHATGVRCILVTSKVIDPDDIVYLLNERHVHTLLFNEDESLDERVVTCIATLRQDFEAHRWGRIADVLTNGSTNFLSDKSVVRFVLDSAKRIEATDILVCLDPAGFLMNGKRKSEFLMIFDSCTRQAIDEISQETGSVGRKRNSSTGRNTPGGFAEERPASFRLGPIDKLSPRSKWWLYRIPVTGDAHVFLQSFGW